MMGHCTACLATLTRGDCFRNRSVRYQFRGNIFVVVTVDNSLHPPYLSRQWMDAAFSSHLEDGAMLLKCFIIKARDELGCEIDVMLHIVQQRCGCGVRRHRLHQQ
jgi:hypothetical protein